jgi:ferrous-iron efflux pump FieF
MAQRRQADVKVAGNQAAGLRRAASYAGLCLAVVMFIAKMTAWLITGSVALLTSVADAGVDLVGSFATVLAVRYARHPPDRAHRFGHGKAESLSALLQAVFLAGAAVTIVADATYRFFVPHSLAQLGTGFVVVAASLAATLALIAFETYVLKHGSSQAIAASRAHHFADVLISLVVLMALGLTILTGWDRFDPIFAISLAAYIFFSAWRIAQQAFAVVLDRELPSADRQRIREAVLSHAQVRGLHDLRTRSAGDRLFVEFHLELDPRISVEEGHLIADQVEQAVRAAFPTAEVLTHQEPAGIADERLDDRVG